MPSVSRKQQRLMHGIASGSIAPKKSQPSVSVAKEFVAADHKRGSADLPKQIATAVLRSK